MEAPPLAKPTMVTRLLANLPVDGINKGWLRISRQIANLKADAIKKAN